MVFDSAELAEMLSEKAVDIILEAVIEDSDPKERAVVPAELEVKDMPIDEGTVDPWLIIPLEKAPDDWAAMLIDKTLDDVAPKRVIAELK